MSTEAIRTRIRVDLEFGGGDYVQVQLTVGRSTILLITSDDGDTCHSSLTCAEAHRLRDALNVSISEMEGE